MGQPLPSRLQLVPFTHSHLRQGPTAEDLVPCFSALGLLVPRASQPSLALFDGTLSSLCHLIPSSVHGWNAWDKRPLDLSLPPWWELVLTPQISAQTANYWHPISQHFTGPSQPVSGIQEMERDAVPFPYAPSVLPHHPLHLSRVLLSLPGCGYLLLLPSFLPSFRLAWDELQVPGCFLSDLYI